MYSCAATDLCLAAAAALLNVEISCPALPYLYYEQVKVTSLTTS